MPAYFERGSLFTRADKPSYLYQLVRVAEGVRGHTANGTPTSPKYLWNLINLANDGKSRVSDTSSMLETDSNFVTLSQLTNNFGLDLRPAGHIREYQEQLAGVARRNNTGSTVDDFLTVLVNYLRPRSTAQYAW